MISDFIDMFRGDWIDKLLALLIATPQYLGGFKTGTTLNEGGAGIAATHCKRIGALPKTKDEGGPETPPSKHSKP